MEIEQMNAEWVAEGNLDWQDKVNEDDWKVWVRIGSLKGIIIAHTAQATAEHIVKLHNESLKPLSDVVQRFFEKALWIADQYDEVVRMKLAEGQTDWADDEGAIHDFHKWMGQALIEISQQAGATSLLLEVRDDSVAQVKLLHQIVEMWMAWQTSPTPNDLFVQMGEIIMHRGLPYLQEKGVTIQPPAQAVMGYSRLHLFTMKGMQVYDYNRNGVIAFSGLPEHQPPPDVTKQLADERRRLTVRVYLED